MHAFERGRSVRAMETKRYPTPTADQVADRLAIHDVIVRYCRGIDRLDEDLVRSAYWPDSNDDHGNYSGNGYEFAAYAIPRLRRSYDATHHVITNSCVYLHGEAAGAETYVHAYHRKGDTVTLFVGRYVDRFEQRAGEWRIADRVCVHDWSRVDPITESMPEGWSSLFVHGQRDTTDTSYHRLP